MILALATIPVRLAASLLGEIMCEPGWENMVCSAALKPGVFVLENDPDPSRREVRLLFGDALPAMLLCCSVDWFWRIEGPAVGVGACWSVGFVPLLLAIRARTADIHLISSSSLGAHKISGLFGVTILNV